MNHASRHERQKWKHTPGLGHCDRVQSEGGQHTWTKLAERQTGSKTVWEMLPYLQTLPLRHEIFMGKQWKTAIFTIIANGWAVFFFIYLTYHRIIWWRWSIWRRQKNSIGAILLLCKSFLQSPEQLHSSSWTKSKSTAIIQIKVDTFSKE